MGSTEIMIDIPNPQSKVNGSFQLRRVELSTTYKESNQASTLLTHQNPQSKVIFLLAGTITRS